MGLSRLDRIAALQIKVIEYSFGETGCEFERRKHAGLHKVGVVAHGPDHVAISRHRPVPFARRGPSSAAAAARRAGIRSAGLRWFAARGSLGASTSSGHVAPYGVGAAIAEGLIHPQHAVVIRRHESEIPRRPQ